MLQSIISSATPDQFSAMAALFEAQLQEHAIDCSVDAIIATLRLVDQHPEYGCVITATVDDLIVGVAYASTILSLEHGGWSGWLEELYILPAWRSQGIGSRLLDAVIEIAHDRDWVALDLEVDDNHQRVISLYASHDFQPVPRTRFVRHLRHEPNTDRLGITPEIADLEVARSSTR
jgi:ribosomal protein S18 acetylase RimI-like enzyme